MQSAPSQNTGALEKRLHPNTLRFYSLPPESKIKHGAPAHLLNAKRLDVIARYIYAKSKIEGIGRQWGEFVYTNFITAQTRNFAKGTLDPGRNSMQDYLDTFDALIDSINAKGFLDTGLIIPTCQGTLVDGAHRLATALACNVPSIETVELAGQPQCVTLADMRRYGMDSDAMGDIARTYIHLKPATRCAVLFPVSSGNHEPAQRILESHVCVDFKIECPLTRAGLKRLQHMLYGHHPWWSEKNAHDFTEKRFNGRHPATLVFFQETQDIRPVKELMRQLPGENNHSLHTTDTHGETTALADIMLNKNSYTWLNAALDHATPKFDAFLSHLKALPESSRRTICIDTGGVLARHGLRDARDLDYLSINNESLPDMEADIALHTGEYESIGLDSETIITNPKYHALIDGIKYASLEVVTKLKKYRASSKDLHDISLIHYITHKDRFVFSIAWQRICTGARYALYLTYHRLFDTIVIWLHRLLPEKYFTGLQNTYRKLAGRG